MRIKNEQIGFRLSANLKRELHDIAKREGRTLSQICEIFVAEGMEGYRKEGPKYVQRLISHQKKEEHSNK
jgi:shikimate kinase